MSKLATKGTWNIAKGKLKQKLARLADDELQFLDGKEDELLGRIQKRTGQSRGKIRHLQDEIDECHGCHH
ncbi:MAG TPA: CsbD family protein [Candidatus Acidoferrales bacterium]|nr:CsbD family protein [Candidatus Acidoferrales bacterium]